MKLVIFLLYLYFAVFPLGQLTKISFETQEINLHLGDMIVGVLVSVWLIVKFLRREKFNLPPLTNPILLFILLAALSLAFNTSALASSFREGPLLSGREMIVSWFYLLRWIAYAALYFVVYDLKLDIRKGLIGIGLASAFLGLLQYFIIPDTRFIEASGWDPHYYRLIGTFLDPGFLGAILVLMIILLTFKIWRGGKGRAWGILMWVVTYLALALTYSRASYLAYLASMGIFSWFKKSPKFFVGVLIVGAVTVFLLPRPGGEGVKLERESTIQFRLINWQQSFNIATDHLLFGVGFNAYRYSQKNYGYLDFANFQASHSGGGADSSLLFVLATTGFLGFLAYLWLWVKIGTRFWKKGNLVIIASVAALIVHSFFSNSLFYPWIMGWFWILLGQSESKG